RSIPRRAATDTAGAAAAAPGSALVPAEATFTWVQPRRSSSARATASAMGERQVFPVQTNRMLYDVPGENVLARDSISFALRLPSGSASVVDIVRTPGDRLGNGEVFGPRDLEVVALTVHDHDRQPTTFEDR